MYYIDPDECIDCGACVDPCPVDAIFPEDEVPEQWRNFTQINADYFKNRRSGSPRPLNGLAKHAVTLIPGDGVGPEICEASIRVLEATGVEFEWDVQKAGEAAIAEFGTPLPEPVLDSIRKNKVALKGPITTPVGSGFRSVNVALRQALDLYALVRPVKAYKGARNLRDDLDFIIVRENTEDIYAGLEFEQGTADAQHLIEEISGLLKRKIRPDSGLSIKPISISGSARI